MIFIGSRVAILVKACLDIRITKNLQLRSQTKICQVFSDIIIAKFIRKGISLLSYNLCHAGVRQAKKTFFNALKAATWTSHSS